MDYPGTEMNLGMLRKSCLAVVLLLTAVWWIFLLSLCALKSRPALGSKIRNPSDFLILLK